MRLGFFLLTTVFLLTFTTAGSVSISPSSFNDHFDPGYERTFEFRASGSGEVQLYIGGELREYATIDDAAFADTGSFKVKLKLPNQLSHPGINTLLVGVMESPEGKGAGSNAVTSLAAVQAPIRIFVPFPGKYIDSKFDVANLNERDKAPYVLEINNLGTEHLNVTAQIDVFAKENLEKILLSEKINATAINTKSSKKWNGHLKTESLPPGDYVAHATINYGPNTILNDTFSVGKEFVEILDYDYLFETGKINKFGIIARSKWNSIMEHVHAEITVTQSGSVIEVIKTPSFQLEPWQTINLTGYIDATNLSAGRYLANILVHYGVDRFSNKLVAIYVNDPAIEEETKEEYPITIIAIYAAGIAWVLYLLIRVWNLKRRLRKKNETKK